MKLDQLVTADRVGVVPPETALTKRDSLERLAALLARGLSVPVDTVLRVLEEREGVQSTGIGEGVAVPHGTLDGAPGQVGALLLCPGGVPFDSIDDRPATIIFGVIGPRQAVEHLKVLARISRLLRNVALRERLLAESDAHGVFELLRREDGAVA